MGAGAETPTKAMPPPPARQPSTVSRPSSASIATAGGDAEGTAVVGSPPEGSEDEDGAPSPKSWQRQGGADVASGPGSVGSSEDVSAIKAEGSNEATEDSPMTGTSLPVQKRRRVTRACDECRRKKIKCDGRQPCTHCSVYSYECTYDKPSNRRRNPAPQYIEALENRLQRAEALLRKFVPDVDLADPKLDPTVQQEFANRERARTQAAKLKQEEAARSQPGPAQDAQLMSMIETIGHLDLIDGNEWDFHGVSSGAVFLRRLKESMGLHNHDSRAPFLPRRPRPQGMFNLDSPRSSASSPWDSNNETATMYELPDKEVARTLCYYSLNCATCLMRIVHVPSFYEMIEQLYEKGPENLGPDDHKALGLLYSVMSLGTMYSSAEDDVHYKVAIEKGLKYYTISRLFLQDITECRDLLSLQALLFMILFLQATSNLSGCYAFLGIALRAALRMGLHRHLPHVKLTPIEDETRRRVFYAIRQMDTYVSALLGYPILLQDQDVDQPMPTEVDDEYITKDAILAPPPGAPSFFQAMNAQGKLMIILAKVIRDIYPVKTIIVEGGNAAYMISYKSIREIESDLQDWYEQLPIEWRPSAEGPVEVVRVRSLLRFTYAHVQMMLYRPFLHYVSSRLSKGKNVDERYYACAAACISVSRNIIRIGMEIKKQAVLLGPYWFILYTEFFAILSLTFYALENPEKAGTDAILTDVYDGREFIASISRRSLAADRVTDGLNALFDQLPDHIKNFQSRGPAREIATKKRSAPGRQTSSNTNAGRGGSSSERRSEESVRSESSHTGSEQHQPQQHRQQIPSRLAFEAAQRRLSPRAGPAPQASFMSSFSDPMPMDMLAERRSPDPAGGSFRGALGPQPIPQRQGYNLGQIYPLDEMMFPSGDPFAYPSQPLADLAPTQGESAAHYSRSQSQQEPMPFYMSGIFDDIEGQLLGPIPSYLMQPLHNPGLHDMAAQMYQASNIISMQQNQRHGMPQAQHGPPHSRGAHGGHHSGQHGGPHGPQQMNSGPQVDIADMVFHDSGFEAFGDQ